MYVALVPASFHQYSLLPVASLQINNKIRILRFCILLYWICWGLWSQHSHHLKSLSIVQLCKAKRQYMLTCKVNRYCLLALLGGFYCCLFPQNTGSLRDREVTCSTSDRQGSNFESCVWRTVSSQSSHQPQDVLLAQFSLYVHKGGLKPDSFHFTQNTR